MENKQRSAEVPRSDEEIFAAMTPEERREYFERERGDYLEMAQHLKGSELVKAGFKGSSRELRELSGEDLFSLVKNATEARDVRADLIDRLNQIIEKKKAMEEGLTASTEEEPEESPELPELLEQPEPTEQPVEERTGIIEELEVPAAAEPEVPAAEEPEVDEFADFFSDEPAPAAAERSGMDPEKKSRIAKVVRRLGAIALTAYMLLNPVVAGDGDDYQKSERPQSDKKVEDGVFFETAENDKLYEDTSGYVGYAEDDIFAVVQDDGSVANNPNKTGPAAYGESLGKDEAAGRAIDHLSVDEIEARGGSATKYYNYWLNGHYGFERGMFYSPASEANFVDILSPEVRESYGIFDRDLKDKAALEDMIELKGPEIRGELGADIKRVLDRDYDMALESISGKYWTSMIVGEFADGELTETNLAQAEGNGSRICLTWTHKETGEKLYLAVSCGGQRLFFEPDGTPIIVEIPDETPEPEVTPTPTPDETERPDPTPRPTPNPGKTGDPRTGGDVSNTGGGRNEVVTRDEAENAGNQGYVGAAGEGGAEQVFVGDDVNKLPGGSSGSNQIVDEGGQNRTPESQSQGDMNGATPDHSEGLAVEREATEQVRRDQAAAEERARNNISDEQFVQEGGNF